MKASAARTEDHPHGAVLVELSPHDSQELTSSIDDVLDALRELDPEREHADRARVLLAELQGKVMAARARIAELPPARVPSDRPTLVDPPPGTSHEEPEPSGREASPPCDLPKYIDVLAAHIPAQHREFTVRIFHCDFTGRRATNEALARTFPTEAAARDFYARTQNIQNMKVRNKEAHAIDVVLGVQDKRSHAKKKSYREWEHTVCKGGPG